VFPNTNNKQFLQKLSHITLLFSKFISTGCNYNSVVTTEQVRLHNNKFEMDFFDLIHSEIAPIYLNFDQNHFLISYSLKPTNFKLVPCKNNKKSNLMKQINKTLLKEYQLKLSFDYLQKVLPSYMSYETN